MLGRGDVTEGFKGVDQVYEGKNVYVLKDNKYNTLVLLDLWMSCKMFNGVLI